MTQLYGIAVVHLWSGYLINYCLLSHLVDKKVKKKLVWRIAILTKVSTVQRDDLQIIIIDTWSERQI